MKNWMKKQVAVLLTLVLAFSVTVPVAAEGTEEKVQTVTVTLSGQANNEFLFAPGEYTIPADEAEKYGYEDEAGGVTTLDALVYAHELAYGKDFTTETKDQYLIISEDNQISAAFGDTMGWYDFVVNGRHPHTEDYLEGFGYDKSTINQAELKSGDQVGFFSYQGSMIEDRYAWFEKDGKEITNFVLEENSATEFVLNGYMSYFQYGVLKDDDIKEETRGVAKAQLTLTQIEEKESKVIESAVTDDEGKVTLSGLTAGNYYLSAYMPKEGDNFIDTPIIMPLCKLQVKAKETPKPEPTPEPTPEPKKDDNTQATTEAKKDTQTTTEVTTEAPTTQQEVVLDKPAGDKVKSTKKKQIKITLKARKNITGYQIEVSTSSKFKKAKVYKVKNTVSSKTIKGLKSKKTYYVRIRTYNQFVENNQKVTIYSKWSKVNKLKVK